MQRLNQSVNDSITQETTTLASCIMIARSDGYIAGFTDHDQHLIIDGVRYESIAGFESSSIVHGSNMAPDNMTMGAYLTSRDEYKKLAEQRGRHPREKAPTRLIDTDLLAGKYDFAEIELFIVDYTRPDSGRLIQKRGVLGEVSLQNNMFYAELRGLTQNLSQDGICNLYSICCRAKLGDNRCRVNLDDYTHQDAVSKAISRQAFTSKGLDKLYLNQRHLGNASIDYFTGGLVRWLTGDNKDIEMEIKESSYSNGAYLISLVLPMPFTIKTHNKFEIIAGCDKSFSACRNKFNNVLNFRGEPDLSAVDRLKSRF